MHFFIHISSFCFLDVHTKSSCFRRQWSIDHFTRIWGAPDLTGLGIYRKQCSYSQVVNESKCFRIVGSTQGKVWLGCCNRLLFFKSSMVNQFKEKIENRLRIRLLLFNSINLAWSVWIYYDEKIVSTRTT